MGINSLLHGFMRTYCIHIFCVGYQSVRFNLKSQFKKFLIKFLDIIVVNKPNSALYSLTHHISHRNSSIIVRNPLTDRFIPSPNIGMRSWISGFSPIRHELAIFSNKVYWKRKTQFMSCNIVNTAVHYRRDY